MSIRKTLSILAVLIMAVSIQKSVTAEEGQSFYSFTVDTIDGEKKNLADHKGKLLLVVNTASRCGYTPQYKTLEKLYEKYKDREFFVLAFPANNFGGQEPGTNEEIKDFCFLNYKTTFPLFSKISVKGDDMAPLYKYLTTRPGYEGDITWNFNKFLISPEGQVIARFESKVDPLSDDVIQAVEKNLPPQ